MEQPTSGAPGTGSSEAMADRTGVCPHCGASTNKGVEQFLARLGISEEIVQNLKESITTENVDEYLNAAREYLKSSGDKARTFTKENPGKVAAGVAVLAIGAGLLLGALNRGNKPGGNP